MKDFLFVAAVLVLSAALLALTPMVFLWSVNNLFGLSIPYNLRSFLAAWALLFVIRVITRTEVKRETLRR